MADPMIDRDEAPELDEAWFAEARPAAEALPEAILRQFGRPGRPKSTNPKQSVTLRLDAEVVEAFKALGPGWQTRMNETLVAAVEKKRA